MDIFGNIGKFFGSLFGGNKDDEEKKKKQQMQAVQTAQTPQKVQTAVQPVNQPQFQQNQPQIPQNGVNLTLPAKFTAGFPQAPQKAPQVDLRNNTQKTLDELTASKLEAARKNSEQGQNWLERTFLNKGANEERAKVDARNQAIHDFQEKNGYVKDPTVMNFQSQTLQKANKNSENAKKAIEDTNKAVDVARWIPGAGLGELGANLIRGNFSGSKEADDTVLREQLGLNQSQIDSLSPEDRGKYLLVGKGGVAAGVLDVAGLGAGALLKNGAKTGLKKAAVTELVKNIASKEGAKAVAKNAAIGAGAGAAIGGGGTLALGGSPDDALQNAGSGALAGAAGGAAQTPFDSAVKLTKVPVKAANELAPGVKSANPNQEADAAAQQAAEIAKAQELNQARIDQQLNPRKASAPVEDTNTPAYMRRAEPELSPQEAYRADQSALRKADSQDARIYDAGLDPSNELDAVPAFQRRGVSDPSALVKAADIQGQLDSIPADVRSTIFKIRERYSQLMRDNPSAAPQLRQRLNNLVAQIQQNPALRESLQNELDSVGLGENTSFRPVESAPVDEIVAPVQPELAPEAITPAPDTAPEVAAAVAPPDAPEVTLAATDVNQPANPVDVAPVNVNAPTPELPATAAQPTVDVAPRSHDALVRQLGPAAQEAKGKYSKKAALNLAELKTNAEGVIANLGDDELLRSFASASPETMIKDSGSFAIARASLERLSQMADDPAAAQTVTNILDAMDRYVSKSGEGLRIVQEEFDNMPLPMKVRYIVKKIDSANAETKNYQPLADDPAKAARVEATITDYLKGSQAINERVSAIQGQLNGIADAALKGEKVDANTNVLTKTLKNEQKALALNNGELVKYYQSLMPKRSLGQKTNDFARRSMLASFTGRVNDVIGTTANITNLGLQNVTQGVLAKAVNLFRPGAATDTLRGSKAFVQGTGRGIQKGASEFTGKQFAGDLQGSLKDNTSARTGLQKATGPISRTIQAATEFATNASEGVRDQRLFQLAVKEGQKAGLKGDLLNQYAKVRAAVPTREMSAAADDLHREINNLNDNPVTRGLNRVAAAIASDKPGVTGTLGGILKNQIMPFTSWLGGNIYNSVTDKNVVASFTKTLISAGKGDVDGVVQNLAKTANNAAYTYALGYLLTQAGVITNENPEGYNDGGAYLNIGGRSIPVAFTGFFAPSIILGNAAYHGLNDNPEGSVAEKITTTATQGLLNLSKAINLNSALGADNNVSRLVTDATRPGSNMDAVDIAAQAGANVGGQFIPAVTGDINAVLNNSDLNPTHEKADTNVKEVNPETGKERKDPTASALASIQNRIPFASQELPRKAGVAAPDLVDRVTKGSRETDTSLQAKADTKATADQKKDFKARGIPNPDEQNFDDAVKARVEDGNYDAAIEGLQAKLKANQKNKDIPKSKNEDIEKQIKTLQVTKDGKFKPETIELYQKTNLTEWRDMGDPESDNYDPDAYKLLYDYDSQLANAGVSRNATKADKNFYFAKERKKSGRGSSGSDALAKIKSNTIGSTPDLPKVSFGNLAPQKAGSVKMPTIQQVKAGELVKKRKISVSKA